MNLVTLFAGRVKPGKNHSDYAFFDGDQVTDFKFRFIRAAYQGLVRRRFLHFPIVTPIYTKRFIGSVGTFASCILSYTKNVRSRPSRLINSPSSHSTLSRGAMLRCPRAITASSGASVNSAKSLSASSH